MERGEHVTNPHEHVTNPHEHVANLHEYVTNLSECVANMSRAPTIMSGLRLKRYNVNVHRAAAKIIVSKNRAARGSVCNVLLSRRFDRAVVVHNYSNFEIALRNKFFRFDSIAFAVHLSSEAPVDFRYFIEPFNKGEI